MITDKLIIETDRLEISYKTPRVSDEQKTFDKSDYVVKTPNHLRLLAYSWRSMEIQIHHKNNIL